MRITAAQVIVCSPGRSYVTLRIETDERLSGRDPARIEETWQYVELGYRAVGPQTGTAGTGESYGVGRGDLSCEPAVERLPAEERFAVEHYLAFVPQLFARLLRGYGHDMHLLHDASHRLRPIEAGRLGEHLEDARLFRLEDHVPFGDGYPYGPASPPVLRGIDGTVTSW